MSHTTYAVHDRMAEQMSRDLNRTLPSPYYARLVMRPENGIVGHETAGRIVPDVAVGGRVRDGVCRHAQKMADRART